MATPSATSGGSNSGGNTLSSALGLFTGASLTPSLQGGAAAPSSVDTGAQTGVGGGQGINVIPIGVNLGSLLLPLQDPPQNGGYGVNLSSPIGAGITSSGGAGLNIPGVGSVGTLALVGAAALVSLIILKRKRG